MESGFQLKLAALVFQIHSEIMLKMIQLRISNGIKLRILSESQIALFLISLGRYYPLMLKVCLNRYSWGARKVGSEYSSWFIQLECISWRFLTMSRLSKCLYHVRSCRNSSEYSKTLGNFLPLLIIRLAQKIVWDIFTIISSDAALPIFNLGLWCFSSRDILN